VITVLLIDDQQLVGQAVRRMLSSEKDIELHFCSDPTQALDMAREIKPTVILQDMVMPKLSGIELIQIFRADAVTRDTPLIVLSSKNDGETQTQAYAYGADDYLIKIPDKFELIKRIRGLATGGATAEATSQPTTHVADQLENETIAADDSVAPIKISIEPTVAYEDLTGMSLLNGVAKVMVAGQHVPIVGGIPLWAKIGQGGMAVVFYGVHPRLQTEVAVKVLPPHLTEKHPQWVDRLFREAQLTARIRSPHLVTVLDINQEADLFYMVMEYVNGQTAQALMAEEQLTEQRALQIIAAATAGLAMAHEQKIVHRDVKPDNILVPCDTKSGEVLYEDAKLADLGIARLDEEDQHLTAEKITMGTLGFMAPEQVRDAAAAGPAADVFSMGATLYCLLSGKIPFTGKSVTERMLATLHHDPEPLAELGGDISEPTIALVGRAMSKTPEDRFKDASTLLKALRVCLECYDKGSRAQKKATVMLRSL
jgi:DNA-binding NarL/FixJ family response regulator